jgi:hypothetical protein
MSGELFLELLPPEFSPVYRSGTLILLGVIAMTAAVACNGLLYVGGLAGWASGNRIVFASITVVGVAALVATDVGATAEHVALVYVFAGLGFLASSYATLARQRRIFLPLRRTLLLTAPAAVVWPALDWTADSLLRLLALAAFVVLYVWYAVALGLLPREEISSIRAAIRPAPTPPSGS